MSNYSQTVVLAALAELSDKSNKDLRAPQYGATRAFNDYKKDLIMNYDDFKNVRVKSDLQTKQIDYLIRDSQSVGSSRAASLTGAMGDSLRDTLTFVTYTREWTMSDDNARNNTQGEVRRMLNNIRNARLDIGAEIESDAVTKLEAYKNTVQGDRDLGTWSNYTSYIANAQATEYYNYMATEMRTLDYNGLLQEVHTANGNALINKQLAQGAGNSENMQYQYPDFEFYTSNSITNLSDAFCTSYVFEQGAVGLLDWIPGKNREGLVNHADFDFTSMADPFGIFDSFAVAIQKKVQDSSSAGSTDIGGNTQDAVWLYEMSIDVAFYIPTITTGKLVNKYALTSA